MPIKLSIPTTTGEIPENYSELFAGSPAKLLSFIIDNLIIEGTIDDKFIASDEKPQGADKIKLWIKTSWPYGIGKLLDGEWGMDFGMCGYPVNTPFLHKKITTLKEGLRELTSTELTDYGISETSVDAKNRMFWYLFEPSL